MAPPAGTGGCCRDLHTWLRGHLGRWECGEGGSAAARLAGSGSAHGDSDQVRNSSRHAIYHRRCSWKLLYKCISSAGRAGKRDYTGQGRGECERHGGTET